jgi:hypothetical protein
MGENSSFITQLFARQSQLPPCDRIFVEEWKSNILLIFNHHQE